MVHVLNTGGEEADVFCACGVVAPHPTGMRVSNPCVIQVSSAEVEKEFEEGRAQGVSLWRASGHFDACCVSEWCSHYHPGSFMCVSNELKYYYYYYINTTTHAPLCAFQMSWTSSLCMPMASMRKYNHGRSIEQNAKNQSKYVR